MVPASRKVFLQFLVLMSLPLSSGRAQTIEGRLFEAGSDAPIPLGEVTLLTQSGLVVAWTVSDESGSFSLTAPSAGSFLLKAERMGYRPSVDGIFDLGEGSAITVEFRLPREPVAMDTLEVAAEGRRMRLELAGFYDRMGRESGVFLGPEEIAGKQAVLPTQLFRNVSRVRLRPLRIGGNAIIIHGAAMISLARRGICNPRVFLDGNEVFRGGQELARLDDVVSVSEIVGIEIYRSPAELPTRYMGARSACGLIMVWTK